MQYKSFDIIQIGKQLYIYTNTNHLVRVVKTMGEAKEFIDGFYARMFAHK